MLVKEASKLLFVNLLLSLQDLDLKLKSPLLIVYTFLIVEQEQAIVRNRVLTHAYDFQTFGVVSVLKIVLQLFYPFVYSLAEERELLNAESVTLLV